MIGVVYERRFDTVTYPSDDGWAEGWGGFQARIMVNPSGSELRTETELYLASNGIDLDAQDRYWQYVAPRVVEWNLELREADGSTRAVPPPAEDWQAFLELDFGVMIWLRMCIHTAHMPDRLGKLQGQKPTIATAAGSSDSTPPTPLPLPNSSAPVVSSSTA